MAILIGQREGGAAKDGGVASGLWAWLVQVGGAKATTGGVLLGGVVNVIGGVAREGVAISGGWSLRGVEPQL